MRSFQTWIRLLTFLSILFALQGISWIIFGSFDPFGFYDGLMAQSLWGREQLSPDAKKTFAFLLGPFGATDAGFFVLMYFLVKYPLKNKEVWAFKAIVTGVLVWFALDTAACLWKRAYFNILIVNIPALIALGIPLFALSPHFRTKQTLPHR